MIPLIKSDSFAPEALYLNAGDVHVWHAELACNSSTLHQLYQTLSPDEQVRAKRFRFVRDKHHFIAARGLLRDLLSRYLFIEPDKISLSYNPQGKPALKHNHHDLKLMFNVSHSHGMVLIAITRQHKIGIDIEYIREDIESDKIAKRFFSAQEVSMLESLPDQQKTLAFYNGWTRKEALLKARGEGLRTPLDKFSVSIAPGEPAALLDCEWDPDETSRWSLDELDIFDQYATALAVEGHPSSITCQPWYF